MKIGLKTWASLNRSPLWKEVLLTAVSFKGGCIMIGYADLAKQTKSPQVIINIELENGNEWQGSMHELSEILKNSFKK